MEIDREIKDKIVANFSKNNTIRDIVTRYGKIMHKTQLYIPEHDNAMMDRLSKKIGLSKSEIVRKAIHEYLRQYDKSQLEEAFGLWEDNQIDLRSMRNDWDR